MTKICFVDFDGPMIPMRAYQLPNQTSPVSVFDPCAVAMLNSLLSISGAKIVISSTWGMFGYGRIVDVLKLNGIDPALLHSDWITPRKMSSSRSDEIRWWLAAHPEVRDYVAIDDEDLDIVRVPKAVKCDTYEGFSWRNYKECCVHLNSFKYPDETKEKYLTEIDLFKRREIWRTKRGYEADSHLAYQAADLVIPIVPANADNF